MDRIDQGMLINCWAGSVMRLRVSIAWRVFFAVFVAMLAIGLTSQWVLHQALKDGFTQYVAEVELSNLDELVTALEARYQQQLGWHIPAKRSASWLKFQYFKSHMPNRFRPQNSMDDAINAQPPPPELNSFKPPPLMEGVAPRFDDRQRPPDWLGLGDRLGLYDAQHRLLSGIGAPKDAPERVLMVNQVVVGYLRVLPQVDPDDALAQSFFADQRQQLLTVGVVAFLASVLAAALLGVHLKRPIERLRQVAHTLTARHFEAHIQLDRSDELGDLGEAMNQLAQMLDQHEKAQQQWVADTSHELRTPVAVLQAQIEAMQDGVRQASPEHLAAMQRQVQLLGRIIGDLQALSQAAAGQLYCHVQAVAADELALHVLDGFLPRFDAQQLHLMQNYQATEVMVWADADRLKQVLTNVLENSLRYTDAGGQVLIKTWSTPECWWCQIDDSAPSVPPHLLEKLGERFFRVDQSRSRQTGGSGLGLAVCRQLMMAQQGQLSFAASALGGLQVRLSVPRMQSSEQENS